MDNYTLTNQNGISVTLLRYGATLSSIIIPLKNGKKVDVVLGFDSIEKYIKSFDSAGAPYFGATVGRYAGRISRGVFSLNGQEYQLHQNNHGNCLHGGAVGFSQKEWQIAAQNSDKNPSVTFKYISPDLEENFPGELQIEVTYTLTEKNEVCIEYAAVSSKDTIVNLTHHSYFNLEGHDASIVDQELFVNAKEVLETNCDNVPSGKMIALQDHAFDFSTIKKCPTTIDSTFVVADNAEVAATLVSKKNGLQMDVTTTQPGIHIYVGGNCSEDLKGKENARYHALSGICFETQNFPDAPNHKNFPTAVLRKGEKYYHKTTYRFQNI